MKIINPRAVRALGDLIKSHKPNILFLMETLSVKEMIKNLCGNLGFENCWSVDCIGRIGGLALVWDKSVHCSIVHFDNNRIDAQIGNFNNNNWRLTGFYGFPARSQRRKSWEFIKILSRKDVIPWCYR